MGFFKYLQISIYKLNFAPKFGCLSLVENLGKWPKWRRPKTTLWSSAHDNPAWAHSDRN